MARPRASLIHRGYLYAQKRVRLQPLFTKSVTQESGSERRMQLAVAWRAGYLAAQNDARERRRAARN